MPEYPAYSSSDLTQESSVSFINDVTIGNDLHVVGYSTMGPAGFYGAVAFNDPITLDVAAETVSAPVSGTVYQNTSGKNLFILLPVTGVTAATTAQLALGSTSSPAAFGGAVTVAVGAVLNLVLLVPINWYWSLTAGTAADLTIGTPSAIGF